MDISASVPQHLRSGDRSALEGRELAPDPVFVAVDLDEHVAQSHDGPLLVRDDDLGQHPAMMASRRRSARPASFRPEIEVGGDATRVLVEQVGGVDVRRLGDLAGHLTREEIWGVDDAIMTVFGRT